MRFKSMKAKKVYWFFRRLFRVRWDPNMLATIWRWNKALRSLDELKHGARARPTIH